METVAIIPARGGSKGIRRKNLQTVGGRTLLARSISAAHSAALVGAVFVSTEDEEIAEEAKRSGAQVVRRPRDLAGDDASSESALLHALEIIDREGRGAPTTVFLQCTSPFTRSSDIDAVASEVIDGRADSAFSAAPFHGFVWRSTSCGAEGVNHSAGESRSRRQDRPAEHLETGAVYAFRTHVFVEAGSRFCGRVRPVELRGPPPLEIDEPEQLEIARLLSPLIDREAGRARLRTAPPSLVALDFDGVLTDNRVLVDERGMEAVLCHRGDGHGLSLLKQLVPVIVLSTEKNPVVSARCEKLGITCTQDLGNNKLSALTEKADQMGIPLEDVLYVGNDVNDLGCLRAVGTAVTVADAVVEARAVSHLVLNEQGGHGAVRELCDLLVPLYTTGSRDRRGNT